MAAALLRSPLMASVVRGLPARPSCLLARLPQSASVGPGQAVSIARRPAAALAAVQGSCAAEAIQHPSEQPLVRISYMSEMVGDCEELDRTIRQIAETAARHNFSESITGFMSYDASLRTVWQVLEGEFDTVMQLWDRIQRDGRHHVDDESVTIERADTRAYPWGWGMNVRVRTANEV